MEGFVGWLLFGVIRVGVVKLLAFVEERDSRGPVDIGLEKEEGVGVWEVVDRRPSWWV